MRNGNPNRVRESEFRFAISQTHNCKARVLKEVIRVTVPRSIGPTWEGDVHVFELAGHNKATRCYAWPEVLSETATIIRAVLHSEKISSPAQAVRVVLRRASQDPRKSIKNERSKKLN
jgi:hypothetical protein